MSNENKPLTAQFIYLRAIQALAQEVLSQSNGPYGVDAERKIITMIEEYAAQQVDAATKKASSKNMCKHEIDAPFYLSMKISGNKLNIGYDAYSCDSSFDESIEINFCPVCGERLLPLLAPQK